MRSAASVDTHAKRGDATQIAAPSPMSGAVDGGKADSETPKPSLDYPSLTVIGADSRGALPSLRSGRFAGLRPEPESTFRLGALVAMMVLA
jgi:hypothetical protein